jgi:hypothetical protein
MRKAPKPDMTKNGIAFFHDSNKIMDLFNFMGPAVCQIILPALDGHDKDSIHFFKVKDVYFLLIKASSPEDPGLALAASDELDKLIHFVSVAPDAVLPEDMKKELITEMLEVLNTEENERAKNTTA